MSHLRFVLLALLLLAAPARAHDYWLVPSGGSDGTSIGLRLLMGDNFVVEAERPFEKKKTLRFLVRITGANNDLASEEGGKPYGMVKTRSVGTHLVVLDRASSLIKLEAEKFNAYLKEEGLKAILDERRKADEDKLPGRERYSRYLKSLIQVGKDRDNATATHIAGQKLEIVPKLNPFSVELGDDLPVLILFEGKPLEGARVFAYRREKDKAKTQVGITSKEGLVTFKLDGSGPWLIRLVHMRRAIKDADADWESFWAALTFTYQV